MAAQTKSLDLESGSGQYAYIADNASISITSSLTIEALLKFESLPNDTFDRTVLGKWGATANKRSYWFSIRNVSGTYYLRGGISSDGTYQGGNDKTVAFTIPTSRWIHLALVFDATVPAFKFYVNGRLVSTQTVSNNSIHNNDSRMSIGAIDSESAAAQFGDGLYKEVRLWSVARTQKQIIEYMGAIASGNETGLVGCWHLENDYNDATANANNLTAVGTPVFASDVPNTLQMKGVENFTLLQKVNINVASLSLSSSPVAYPVNIGNLLEDTYAALKEDGLYTKGLFNDANLKALYRFQAGGLLADSKASYTLSQGGSGTDVAEYTGGRFGGCASFVGGKYLTIANDLGISGGVISMNCWVKIPTDITTGTWTFINQTDNSSSRVGYQIRYQYNAGTRRLEFNRQRADVDDTNNFYYNVNLGDNEWHMITLTYDGSNVRGYLDGVYVGYVSDTGNGLGAGGADLFLLGGSMNGYMDDVAIFNRQLTTAEIADLYKEVADDLRFTIDADGLYEVPYEIVKMSKSAHTSQIWGLLPELNNANANYLYVWGSNSSAYMYNKYDVMGSQSVWRAEFRMVQHLDETTNNTGSSARLDSTAYANDLDDVNSVLQASSGKIGAGADFESSNSEYLTKASNIISAYTRPVSFELWVNPESLPGSPNSMTVLSLSPKDGSNNSRDFYLQIRNNSGTYEARLVIYTNNYFYATKSFTLNPGEWHHIVATYNGTTSSKIYVDGDIANPGTATPVNTSYVNANNYYLKVGANSTPDNYFDGVQDELRIIEEEYSIDWIKADYNLQNAPATYIINELLGGGGGAAPIYQFL